MYPSLQSSLFYSSLFHHHQFRNNPYTQTHICAHDQFVYTHCCNTGAEHNNNVSTWSICDEAEDDEDNDDYWNTVGISAGGGGGAGAWWAGSIGSSKVVAFIFGGRCPARPVGVLGAAAGGGGGWGGACGIGACSASSLVARSTVCVCAIRASRGLLSHRCLLHLFYDYVLVVSG